MELDKREQAGDWTRRPLTESQVTYAALDAEVLLRLHAHFEEVARSLSRGVHIDGMNGERGPVLTFLSNIVLGTRGARVS